jgi:hypothetical protein
MIGNTDNVHANVELIYSRNPRQIAGFYVERRLSDQYGDEALRGLAEETGLALTQRLRPYLGTYLSLLVGLVYAVVLHFFGGRGGIRGLNNQISILGGLVNALTGTAAICLDTEGAARRAKVFEPFRVFGLRHAGAFSYAMAKNLAALTEDRTGETIEELTELLDRLQTTGGVIGFPDRMKPLTTGGLLYALGALESFMDAPLALERASALEACGLRLFDMVACQIRVNYHACRGESALAEEFERKVEAHAMRSGSTWQAEVWAPSSRVLSSMLIGDVVGLKRTVEDLERLARDIPSLNRYARTAHAVLKVLRGEYDAAITALVGILGETSPRGFLGWCAMAGLLARAYNETQQYRSAEKLCTEVLGMLSERDRNLVAMNLQIEIQLALAEAGLGRAERGARRLDDLLEKHGPNRGPVTMGSLHRARVEVALRALDRHAASYHQQQMEAWFHSTDNSVLIAECERMLALIRPSSAPPAAESANAEVVTTADRGATSVDAPAPVVRASAGRR